MTDRAPTKTFCGSDRFSSPRAIHSISPAAPSRSHVRNSSPCRGGAAAVTLQESNPRAWARLAISLFRSVSTLGGGTVGFTSSPYSEGLFPPLPGRSGAMYPPRSPRPRDRSARALAIISRECRADLLFAKADVSSAARRAGRAFLHPLRDERVFPAGATGRRCRDVTRFLHQ